MADIERLRAEAAAAVARLEEALAPAPAGESAEGTCRVCGQPAQEPFLAYCSREHKALAHGHESTGYVRERIRESKATRVARADANAEYAERIVAALAGTKGTGKATVVSVPSRTMGLLNAVAKPLPHEVSRALVARKGVAPHVDVTLPSTTATALKAALTS